MEILGSQVPLPTPAWEYFLVAVPAVNAAAFSTADLSFQGHLQIAAWDCFLADVRGEHAPLLTSGFELPRS
jgi:hypothetical protein